MASQPGSVVGQKRWCPVAVYLAPYQTGHRQMNLVLRTLHQSVVAAAVAQYRTEPLLVAAGMYLAEHRKRSLLLEH